MVIHSILAYVITELKSEVKKGPIFVMLKDVERLVNDSPQ